MIHHHHRSSRRTGFTLVEMLVAMALTVFVMAILSQAFVAALETFSGLKSLGDMNQNLRTAMNVIMADLTQEHIDGGRKLSDPGLQNDRPREGYFMIRQGTAVDGNPANSSLYQFEGLDADGLESRRAVNHVMQFTIRLRGNRRENVMMTYDIPTFAPQPPNHRWSPLSKPNAYAQTKTGYITATSPLATPLVVTSLNHGLQSGEEVYIWGVQGNTNANNTTTKPTHTITVVNANMFLLNGETSNGLYLGGGTWTQPASQRRDALHNPGGPPNYDSYRRDRATFAPGLTPWPLFPPPGNAQPQPDIFASQWAEVAYFLMRTGTTDNPNNPIAGQGLGTPLFSLFRTQYLLVPNPKEANAPTGNSVGTTDVPFLANGFYQGVSCKPGTLNLLTFNSPAMVADPTPFGIFTNGLNARPLNLHSVALPIVTRPRKAGLVCPNVLSFQIQGMLNTGTGFGDLNFETTQTIPAGLKAIKITLRVYDPNMQFSRQLTIIQDM
jgi:prepilin-type N-terminal cleavage/methylation domain-containing protein